MKTMVTEFDFLIFGNIKALIEFKLIISTLHVSVSALITINPDPIFFGFDRLRRFCLLNKVFAESFLNCMSVILKPIHIYSPFNLSILFEYTLEMRRHRVSDVFILTGIELQQQ
jgi:hypothetical protein